MLTVDAHPCLDLKAFFTTFPGGLQRGWPGLSLPELMSVPGPGLTGVEDDGVKAHVRDLLRVGGFKPSGRSKPASEYVQKAIPAAKLGAINAAVDPCNMASFHSGLPISVIDVDRAHGALRVGIAEAGTKYVFNASGQVIDVGGLLCLFDDSGPCANAVKDSQRTKTHPGTERTLSIIWGTTELPGRAATLARWYRAALEAAGASTERVG